MTDIIRSTINAVFVVNAHTFGPNGEVSAIQKQRIWRPVSVTPLGLQGNEQGKKLYHGRPDKAVHHYPSEYKAIWRAHFGDDAVSAFHPGGFGENISTEGRAEHNVYVGDFFTMGVAMLQVTQARQPCWKLNLRFEKSDMASIAQNSLRTGWYYRVLQVGTVMPDDALRLVDRSQPDWPLARLLRYLYIETMNEAAMRIMSELEVLTPSWRKIAQDRLSKGCVEDWQRRLQTPALI